VLWLLLVLAVAAGAGLPFQAGVNASLATALESPLRAALVSFAAGTLLLLVVALVFAGGLPSGSRLSEAPWWAWTGGAFGALYVTVAVVVAPRLGVVFLLAATLAGQAVASAVIDHLGWVGLRDHPISPGRLAGVALTLVGVGMVRFL